MIPGKLFEYIASRRPVLILGPEGGDASAILDEVHAGCSCEFRDHNAIKAAVLRLYENHKKDGLPDIDSPIDAYSNKNTTRTLALCLNSIART